jgi:hypothetical protein
MNDIFNSETDSLLFRRSGGTNRFDFQGAAYTYVFCLRFLTSVTRGHAFLCVSIVSLARLALKSHTCERSLLGDSWVGFLRMESGLSTQKHLRNR